MTSGENIIIGLLAAIIISMIAVSVRLDEIDKNLTALMSHQITMSKLDNLERTLGR